MIRAVGGVPSARKGRETAAVSLKPSLIFTRTRAAFPRSRKRPGTTARPVLAPVNTGRQPDRPLAENSTVALSVSLSGSLAVQRTVSRLRLPPPIRAPAPGDRTLTFGGLDFVLRATTWPLDKSSTVVAPLGMPTTKLPVPDSLERMILAPTTPRVLP